MFSCLIWIIKESKRSLKKIEHHLEERSEDFTDEVKEFWDDLKKNLSNVELHKKKEE